MLESPTTIDIRPRSVHVIGTTDTLVMIFRKGTGRVMRLEHSNFGYIFWQWSRQRGEVSDDFAWIPLRVVLLAILLSLIVKLIRWVWFLLRLVGVLWMIHHMVWWRWCRHMKHESRINGRMLARNRINLHCTVRGAERFFFVEPPTPREDCLKSVW